MNPQNCEVGDLSNKHAKINIPRSPSPYRNNGFFYTDTFLNLSSVINRSIAIHQANSGSPIIACAPLVEVEILQVQKVFGEFAAWQSNRFENTTVTSSIEASRLSLLSHVIAPNQLCHTELAATNPSTYNPHSQSTSDGNINTPDRFAIGDISGTPWSTILVLRGESLIFPSMVPTLLLFVHWLRQLVQCEPRALQNYCTVNSASL